MSHDEILALVKECVPTRDADNDGNISNEELLWNSTILRLPDAYQTQVADWDGEQGAAGESPAAAAPAAEEPATQAGAAEADDDSDDSDDSLDL